MKKLYDSGIAFAYQGKPLRSAFETNSGCWFVCADLFDMLDAQVDERILLSANNAVYIATAVISFNPPLTCQCVNAAGLYVIISSLLQDDASNVLIGRIYAEIIHPIRKRLPLLDARMPA